MEVGNQSDEEAGPGEELIRPKECPGSREEGSKMREGTGEWSRLGRGHAR